MPIATPEELVLHPPPPLPKWVTHFNLLPKPEYQIQFLNKGKGGKPGEPYWVSNYGAQTWALMCPFDEILIGGARGGAKLSPLDSLVCTPKGFVKMGDIAVGDAVTDPTTGGATRVIAVHPHTDKDIWRFTFDDGASLEVGAEHLWTFRLSNHKRPATKNSSERQFSREVLGGDPVRRRWDLLKVGTTKELIELHDSGEKIRIPLTEPIIFTNLLREPSIDPYLIGLFLGDGYLRGLSLTSADPEIGALMTDLGCSVQHKLFNKASSYRLRGKSRKKFDKYFRNHGLIDKHSWDKFIPDGLKHGPLSDRLEVIRGLMDTDGTVDDRGRVSFTSTSKQLALDVQFIARSLGAKARIAQKKTFFTHRGEKKQGRDAYKVRIWHPKASCLFRLKRKIDRCTDRWNGGHEISRELKSVEYIGRKDAKCITVSAPYGLYVADDFIVTHNSACLIAWFAMGDPSLTPDDPARYSYLLEPTFRGLMLRKEYIALAEFVDEAEEFFRPLGGKRKDDPAVFTFPSGAKIYTNHLGDANAFEKYRGQGITKIGIEELTQIEGEQWYLKLFGSLRAKRQVRIHNGRKFRALRSQIMSTTNPDGPGSPWVKRRFVKVYNGAGKLIEWNTPMIDHFTGLSRIFIPMARKDNPYLRSNKQYEGMILSQNETTRRQWQGDWDAGTGVFFGDFRPRGPIGDEEKRDYPNARHVVDAAELKPWWYRWGSGDHGYEHWAAFHKFCRSEKDGRVHIYDELKLRKTGSFELGVRVAEWWIPDLERLPDKSITLTYSHEAFHKDDAGHTKADEFLEGIKSVLGPYGAFLMKYSDEELETMRRDPEVAAQMFNRRRMEHSQGRMAINVKMSSRDRSGGFSYMRDLLRFRPVLVETEEQLSRRLMETFQRGGVEAYERERSKVKRPVDEALPKLILWARCAGLIRCIEESVQDPDNPEEVLKKDADENGVGGDDELDSCFIAGTMVQTPDGQRRIEAIQVGDLVETRLGPRRVISTGLTQENANLKILSASNGTTLIGTGNHPVFIQEKGFFRLDTLSNGDNLEVWPKAKLSCSMESNSGDIRSLNGGTFDAIFGPLEITGTAASMHCIARSGNLLMGQFLQNTISTIETKTRSIMKSRISRLSQRESTTTTMAYKSNKPRIFDLFNHSAWKRQPLGTRAKRVERSGAETRSFCEMLHTTKRTAWFAGKHSKRNTNSRISSVLLRASSAIYALILDLRKIARCALNLLSPKKKGLGSVGVHVLAVTSGGIGPVYNLEVEDVHEYFANGILVHNCRYGLKEFKEVEKTMPKIYYVSEQMERIQTQQKENTGSEITDINRLIMIRKTQENRYDHQHPVQTRFNPPRASGGRHRARAFPRR